MAGGFKLGWSWLTRAALIFALAWLMGAAAQAETKDRVTRDELLRLVEGPIALAREGRLKEAQQAFEADLARTKAEYGEDSKEAADKLRAMGVSLYLAEGALERGVYAAAALPYLERSIDAMRAAWGPRHPEVALSLTDYARAAEGRINPLPALGEAYEIRVEALGPSDPETLSAMREIQRAARPATLPSEPSPKPSRTEERLVPPSLEAATKGELLLGATSMFEGLMLMWLLLLVFVLGVTGLVALSRRWLRRRRG